MGKKSKERVATYLLPDGTEKDQFSFTMNADGYKAFSEKIPKDVRIAFEASGSSYSVDRNLRNLGYSDITVAHPKELSWIIKSKKKNDPYLCPFVPLQFNRNLL